MAGDEKTHTGPCSPNVRLTERRFTGDGPSRLGAASSIPDSTPTMKERDRAWRPLPSFATS
jgi:hypothetical protein